MGSIFYKHKNNYFMTDMKCAKCNVGAMKADPSKPGMAKCDKCGDMTKMDGCKGKMEGGCKGKMEGQCKGKM